MTRLQMATQNYARASELLRSVFCVPWLWVVGNYKNLGVLLFH